MSSDSSSRLRQFGLYKTIDSKTAEFLKLSRKRQIRRGCACAAVSTAITVTVVVGAFLVYEFAFRTDFKTVPKTSRYSSWFNTDTDAASFDKHSPIKNNGKLLAIILKALDQKRYLEAIVDEYSSDKPPPESSTVYQKNVFTDARSRKVTRYKPRPFTKNRGKDSIEKAKKIMDYQRVMTYLNSMSFTRTTDETARDISSTQQPSRLKEKLRIDKFGQDYQFSTTETPLVRNVSAKPNITLEKQACCTCPSRTNLTDMLGKLYKSIQQLSPRKIIGKKDNAKVKNNNTTTTLKKYQYNYRSKVDNKDMATTVKIQQTKFPFKITTTSIQTKHITTTINPKIEIAAYEHSTVFNITINNTDGVKYSTIEENETTTNLNFNSSTSYEDKTSYKEELARGKEIFGNWKLDFTDVVYDTANDNAQTEYSSTDRSRPTVTDNITNENNRVNDITVKYAPYTTPHYVKSDFDDRIVQIPSPVFMKRKEKEKTPVDTDFVNYLSSFNKLQTMVFNKPQKPDTFNENPRLKQWNFEHFLTDEEADPLELVSDPTEKRRTQESIEKFYENHSPNTRDKPVVHELGSDSFMKENYEKPKSTTENTLERVANTADEKLPLTPMIQTFLLSKKESGVILNLDETTTTSIKLQTDSVEDLPFNVSFYEDYEDSSNLKTTSTSTVTPAKGAHKHGIKLNTYDHATSLDTTTYINEAHHHIQHYIHTIRDEDVSTLRTNTRTSNNEAQKQYINREEDVRSLETNIRTLNKINKDEIVRSSKTRTKAFTEVAQKGHIDRDEIVSSETRTKVSTNETQQDDTNRDKNVSNLKTHNMTSTRDAQHINRDESGSGDVPLVPKKVKKLPKIISRIRSWEPAAIESPKLTEPPTNLKTPKTSEIFYMTGNEAPIDDFETKLNAMMYFDTSPVNYTALANSFLNKVDSTSIESLNSMIPLNGASHLEIRRHHDLFDTMNWYTNDEQNYGFQI